MFVYGKENEQLIGNAQQQGGIMQIIVLKHKGRHIGVVYFLGVGSWGEFAFCQDPMPNGTGLHGTVTLR